VNVVLGATLARVVPGAFRRLSMPLWLVTLGGLVATYTRGAWLGLVAGAAALLPMSRRGRLVLLAGLVLLPAIFLLGPQDLRHRFRSLFGPAAAGGTGRLYMWRRAPPVGAARP